MNPFLRPAIVSRILADDRKTLQRMASIRQLSVGLGGKPPPRDYPTSTIEDWMLSYPEDFRSEIEKLEQTTPRAEDICEEILGKEFPNPLRMRTEIDAIVAKLDNLGDAEIPAKRSTRNFDSEAANAAFQRDVERKDIKMESWLNDSFETWAKTSGGIPYRLGFTRDVIDFLLKGYHFGTCLSPGDCNFFSTVANAVDINKRVVYGKSESGKIIGRCLFALNDDGHIVTYHRYAHEAEDRFDLAVDHFAAELAVAMNSRLTKRGTIQNLIAKTWYDDGAVGEDNLAAIDRTIRSLFGKTASEDLFDQLQSVISRDQICSRLDDLSWLGN